MVLNHFPENPAPLAPESERGGKTAGAGCRVGLPTRHPKNGPIPPQPRSSGAGGAGFPPLLFTRILSPTRAREQSYGNPAPPAPAGTRP